MIPVTDEYIAGEFFIDNVHYVVKNRVLIRDISRKARNFIKQLKIGRMSSQVDALNIRDKLVQ